MEEHTLFRKSTMQRISSPDQLNEYIRVTSQGVWLLLAALFIMLAGALIWGFMGEIKTTRNVTAVVTNGEAVFYSADVTIYSAGMEVDFQSGEKGVITSISSEPITRSYIEAKYDEYTVFELDPPEWAYKIAVSAQGVNDGLSVLSVVIDTVTPISFILN